MIRSYVLSVLKSACSQVKYPPVDESYVHSYEFMDGLNASQNTCSFPQQVQEAIRSSGANKASLSEGVEASVIYIRFKAAASEVTISFFVLKAATCVEI